MGKVIDLDKQRFIGTLRAEYERAATKRGYSPERANEIAKIVADAMERIDNMAVSVSVPSPDSLTRENTETFAHEVAKATARQVAMFCVEQLSIAAVDLAYPA